MKKLRILIALMLLVLSGCSLAIEEHAIEPLAYGSSSKVEEKKNIVVKNKEELEDLLPLLRLSDSELDELSNFDFENEMIVGVFRGKSSSPGYGISIKKVVDKSLFVEVQFAKTSPKGGGLYAAVLSEPFDLVKTAKTEKLVIFREVGE